MKANNWAHYGDIIAIPFFFITFLYFYRKETKTLQEELIMLFILTALIMDIIFTWHFYKSAAKHW